MILVPALRGVVVAVATILAATTAHAVAFSIEITQIEYGSLSRSLGSLDSFATATSEAFGDQLRWKTSAYAPDRGPGRGP